MTVLMKSLKRVEETGYPFSTSMLFVMNSGWPKQLLNNTDIVHIMLEGILSALSFCRRFSLGTI